MKVPEAVMDAALNGHPESWRETIEASVERALEQLREELTTGEALGRMLTILGERDWGLLHPTGDMEPAALVEQTSADLRAAIEGAFSVLGDKEEGR